ncbi:MAG: AsmA-like C-terminal region-containing protein [Pseudomonadales bacterium]
MSSTREPGWSQRYILRPLFIFVSFVLVLFALLQISGRFAMATLHLFEDEVALLAEQFEVRLVGLQGGWSGFNPHLRVDELVFSGGYARGLVVELDVLESIWHSAWVARRLQGEEVYLDVVQEGGGWRLRGMQPREQSVDLTDLLNYSDELQADLRISLQNAAGIQSEINASLRLANHSSQQFATLTVASDGGQRSLIVQGWRQLSSVLQDRAAEVRMHAEGDLAVPAALADASVLVEVVSAAWSETGGIGQGQLTLATRLALPQLKDELGAEVRADLSSLDGVVSGLLDTLKISGRSGVVDLSGGRFKAQLTDDLMHPQARLWLPEVDLGKVTGFIAAEFGPDHKVGEWTAATAIKGAAHNLHAFYNTQLGLGYRASLADVSMRGHRGAPGFKKVQGQLWGHTRGAAFQANTQQATLNFPDLFTDTWDLDYLQGTVKVWFREGYMGLRGEHLKTQIGQSGVAGSFSLTRPQEQYEQRVALGLYVDQATMQDVHSFVPYKIPENLTEWLAYGPLAGQLSNAAFAYQGQVHKDDESGLHRRIELVSDISQGEVRYEQSWPVVSAVDGEFHVAGQEIRVNVARARSAGVDIADGWVVLHDNAAYARGELGVTADGQALLDFVLASPLKENLAFVTPAWQAAGRMQMKTSLVVPIKQVQPADTLDQEGSEGVADGPQLPQLPELQVNLDFNLTDFDLDMPEYRTRFAALRGNGTFALPHHLEGSFSGLLFDQPTQITAHSDPDWLRFDITGEVTPEHVYRTAGLPELNVLEGSFAFNSQFSVAMNDSMITNLELVSDLAGMQVRLPAQLAKAANAVEPLELGVQFLRDYQSIRWQYKETQGWVHFGDGIERGAIGVNAALPTTDLSQQAILIRGKLDQVALGDWVSDDGEAAVALPQDWIIQSLQIGELLVDELRFADVLLKGSQTGSNVAFEVASETIAGTIDLPQDEVMAIRLDYLHLPQPDNSPSVSDQLMGSVGYQQALALPEAPEQNDPLSVAVGRRLPAAQIEVAELHIGDQPFGRWSFAIEPQQHGVQLRDFNVDVNGVHIEGADVHWDLVANQSHFQGTVVLDDLKDTLPKWDYAAALETSEALLIADSTWAGSPANVSLLGLNGELRFRAAEGRFLDVESGGGLRVLSLLNFSNIAKRISFDFSDVTRDGMPFDKISAHVDLENGTLRFLDRMEVESKSSNFQIGGQVNLRSGVLDNEMIVTLPVSDSLPWYGVYLAIANPLAGLGVLVGERVLRKPLRAFSTAKFEVKGTLDEPEVNFVSLWDQSMRETESRTDGEGQNGTPVESKETDQEVQQVQGEVLGGSR